MTDILKKIAEYRGRVTYEDRRKRMNAAEGPRWTAYVNVFGHDSVGEGETKPAAASAAIARLPAATRRHFE